MTAAAATNTPSPPPPPPPKLTKSQRNLLDELHTSYHHGLSPENGTTGGGATVNRLNPPLNCPAWACIVLPCINHVPSMKLYQRIKPSDAEVIRNSKWIFYDAVSLKRGDIIRLNEGDLVPADCCVLSLGMDHLPLGGGDGDDDDDDDDVGEEEMDRRRRQHDPRNDEEELVVDLSNITGQNRPKTITSFTIRSSALSLSSPSYLSSINGSNAGTDPKNCNSHALDLYCGSLVLQGSAIAVVTRIGEDTSVSTWMREGKWPPSSSSSSSGYSRVSGREENGGEGEEEISLVEVKDDDDGNNA